MTDHTFTDDDAGKSVVDSTGDEIGVIADVRDGDAYVDPDASLVEAIGAKLGWESADEDAYPLRDDDVTTVTDHEVRLRRL